MLPFNLIDGEFSYKNKNKLTLFYVKLAITGCSVQPRNASQVGVMGTIVQNLKHVEQVLKG